MILPLPAVPVLAASCLWAAWSDVRLRRLSNLLVVCTAALGLLVALSNGGFPEFASTMLHGAIALLLGLPLFGLGLLGGGDVKYYAALAAWFPIEHGFRLLACVSLTGAVLAAAWLVGQRIGTAPSADRADAHRDKVPFGVAIGSGALLTALAFSR